MMKVKASLVTRTSYTFPVNRDIFYYYLNITQSCMVHICSPFRSLFSPKKTMGPGISSQWGDSVVGLSYVHTH